MNENRFSPQKQQVAQFVEDLNEKTRIRKQSEAEAQERANDPDRAGFELAGNDENYEKILKVLRQAVVEGVDVPVYSVSKAPIPGGPSVDYVGVVTGDNYRHNNTPENRVYRLIDHYKQYGHPDRYRVWWIKPSEFERMVEAQQQ